MEKHRKQAVILSTLGVVMILFGVTYSFFNYTRTGSANNLRTGRIYFNTTHGDALNLTNVFPMTATEAGNATLDTVIVGIAGDTTYADGEEFEITLVDVTNTINGKQVPITPYSKQEVDNILTSHGIKLENNALKDYLYAANMCKADFFGSSIEDNLHVARFIKDVIDDPDGYDGLVFNRWLADMARKGEPIDWDEFWTDKV
jgi:hypothetical protein